MYAPIFPSHYIKKEIWHRVNPHDSTRAACNHRAVLDHERTQADLPEGATFCSHCSKRTPYLERSLQHDGAGPYTLDELLAGMTEENLHGEVRPDSAVGEEFPNNETADGGDAPVKT